MSATTSTPMMAQWRECKAKAKEALLLFRLGDFYEAFYEDAKVISKEIHLTLTSRQGIPMCGVPFHTAELYIDKLISKGFKIAIAEQMEDPKEAKGLLKREITRFITPGTILQSKLLSEKRNNYFASIAQIGSTFGLSFVDVTTGEFRALELEQEEDLLDELYRLKPAEFLASKKFQEAHPLFFKELSFAFPFLVNEKESIDLQTAQAALFSHFQIKSLDTFPLKGELAAIAAAGVLLLHLKEELSFDISAIASLQTEPLSQYMGIDRSTMRHLELTEPFNKGEGKQTLFDLLDETMTPMGARLLSQWIKHPLLSVEEIERRQEAVASFLSHSEISQKGRKLLEGVRDLERLAMKIANRSATPRDVLALALSLSHLPSLKEALLPLSASLIQSDLSSLFDTAPLSKKIFNALSDHPPLRTGEGEIFREEFNQELDSLRKLASDSMSWMARYQNSLREETGIKTLKVGFTKAFGYYIEVSRAQADKAPPHFQRRQTLVNGERFATEELKQFEYQLLSAEERSCALEAELFETLRLEIAREAAAIQKAAQAVGRLDLFLSLAQVAKERRWICPRVDMSMRLEIQEGRHPIVEEAIGSPAFIANDTALSHERQMMLITGPNMAGKSTYIRQVALLAILAQIGSFIPAQSAHIGIVDKVFSRIGASDDLARGQSTFMVEMTETANILHFATSRSLILLDEIGRGTSTYDGIAIAWAVAEYLLTAQGKQARTLFATHYWELTRLEAAFPNVANFHSAIQDTPSGIVFLRKIVPGGTDKSYGIHVAKLAGLPFQVIHRAEAMLLQLEAKRSRSKKAPAQQQLSLFPPESPLLQELAEIDPTSLTPLQALQKLSAWKEQVSKHAL